MSSTLAILTQIPLLEAEVGYDKDEATRFLEELGDYKERNKIDVVEILRGTSGS